MTTKENSKESLATDNQFDSDEELYFSDYLAELKHADIILHFERHQTLNLMEPVKTNGRSLFREQVYTPDFLVVWNPLIAVPLGIVTDTDHHVKGVPFKAYYDSNDQLVSSIEVKGGYTEQDETRLYGVLFKWTWSKFGIFVQKINVSNTAKDIFAKTFTPNSFLTTKKTKKPRKLHYEPISLSCFLQSLFLKNP